MRPVLPLPSYHPCAFANPWLADPFVEDLIGAHETLSKEKDQCVRGGNFDRALKIFRLQEKLITELKARCARVSLGENAVDGDEEN